ncbi:hypothetical protein DFH09DRAFT_1275023 [Mycena vulgaris]|nr:hypothetical protein DFH09DRAFT_1275023 [Mycena vulgaris]
MSCKKTRPEISLNIGAFWRSSDVPGLWIVHADPARETRIEPTAVSPSSISGLLVLVLGCVRIQVGISVKVDDLVAWLVGLYLTAGISRPADKGKRRSFVPAGGPPSEDAALGGIDYINLGAPCRAERGSNLAAASSSMARSEIGDVPMFSHAAILTSFSIAVSPHRSPAASSETTGELRNCTSLGYVERSGSNTTLWFKVARGCGYSTRPRLDTAPTIRLETRSGRTYMRIQPANRESSLDRIQNEASPSSCLSSCASLCPSVRPSVCLSLPTHPPGTHESRPPRYQCNVFYIRSSGRGLGLVVQIYLYIIGAHRGVDATSSMYIWSSGRGLGLVVQVGVVDSGVGDLTRERVSTVVTMSVSLTTPKIEYLRILQIYVPLSSTAPRPPYLTSQV